jgi:hypothetical protein
MANHCYNWASLEGSKEMLDLLESRLKEATAEQSHLWYETFFTVLGKEKEEGDTYDLFGSKWFEADWSRLSDTAIGLSGSSAWSPVLSFYVELSEIYNLNITAEYEEPGMDFGGWFCVNKGTTIKDISVSYEEFLWKNDEDHAIEKFIDDISNGYYESINKIMSHVYWDKLSESDKQLAVSSFKEYNS